MLVRDLLLRKGSFVVTIAPDAPVRQLLVALAEHDVGALVVSADGATVSGVVSERDIVRALKDDPDDLPMAPVEAIMTVQVITATAEDSLDRLMLLMTEQHIRHVPILTEGRLSGIVSIGDVVKTRIDELESERQALLGYIRAGGDSNESA